MTFAGLPCQVYCRACLASHHLCEIGYDVFTCLVCGAYDGNGLAVAPDQELADSIYRLGGPDAVKAWLVTLVQPTRTTATGSAPRPGGIDLGHGQTVYLTTPTAITED